MTEVLTYEALKAERDAQQKRADALVVENAALKSRSIKLFNLGYLHGHESTVEGYFVDVHRNDIDTYHDDVVAEIIEDEEETPATDAALAAIRNEATARALKHLCDCQLISATVAELKANELREGK
ncbi:TPA: hypothetical protein SMF43_001510 [Serratia marcescens]|nr:hypothetical protein [Serratia marcescens]